MVLISNGELHSLVSSCHGALCRASARNRNVWTPLAPTAKTGTPPTCTPNSVCCLPRESGAITIRPTDRPSRHGAAIKVLEVDGWQPGYLNFEKNQNVASAAAAMTSAAAAILALLVSIIAVLVAVISARQQKSS